MITIYFNNGNVTSFSLKEYNLKYYDAIKMVIVSPINGNKSLPKGEYPITDIYKVEIT